MPAYRAAAVAAFRRWLETGDDLCRHPRVHRHDPTAHLPPVRLAVLAALPDLRGKDLACWCRPEDECHADVLLELVAKLEPA